MCTGLARHMMLDHAGVFRRAQPRFAGDGAIHGRSQHVGVLSAYVALCNFTF